MTKEGAPEQQAKARTRSHGPTQRQQKTHSIARTCSGRFHFIFKDLRPVQKTCCKYCSKADVTPFLNSFEHLRTVSDLRLSLTKTRDEGTVCGDQGSKDGSGVVVGVRRRPKRCGVASDTARCATAHLSPLPPPQRQNEQTNEHTL